MQQGKMVSAYSEAVKSAAENSAGAMNGFMGIGMMNMNTGNVVEGAVSGPWNNTENSKMDLSKQEEVTEKAETKTTEKPEVVEGAKEEASNKWNCECGIKNEGNFCVNCGSPRPRICKKCNSKLGKNAKFCSNCGEKVE